MEALDRKKAAVRQRLRLVLGALSGELRTSASAALAERVRRSREWAAAGAVALYWALKDEPDLRGLLGEAFADGKRVALPRFREDRGDYELAWVAEVGTMVLGRYGILEPAPDALAMTLKPLDLILVPGVGFSPDGCRLGRGGGFYDRLLASFPGLKCGVAFDEQVVDALPVGPDDIRLDCILTPTRGWSAGRRVVAE